jgi:hypothetical protein
MSDDEIVDELRGAIQLWRGMADQGGVPSPNAVTLRWCADELEALLDEVSGE